MSNSQKYCADCQAGEAKRRGAARYAMNPDKFKADSAACRLAHPEREKAYKVAYRLANPEEVRAYQATYRAEHPEERRAAGKVLRATYPNDHKEWVLANPDRIKEHRRTFYVAHREQCLARMTKRRDLGFIPLNAPFSGAEAHHVSKEYVVYIPETLHRSVSHNVWTGKNMEQINFLALGYLVRQLECVA